MKILVTGGAGYIGSITAKNLTEKGHEVVVFDNLKRGHREAVKCKLVVGDLLNKDDLEEGLKGEKFDAVIHFAAYALAGESMENPYMYFENNVIGGLNLLEYMKNKIKYIVFSSTCAVYGTPKKLPVSEEEAKDPESVYGESKLTFEKVLHWYDRLFNIKHINLRYFNAAGASLDASLGEDHDPIETHIIPRAIKAALGEAEFDLYGTDYETKDGTAVRDYIHVEDLAQVHIQALEKLMNDNNSDSFNLGTGRGYSNLEVIEMVRKVSKVDFKVNKMPRRAGDPPLIYADNKKAKEFLGFNPKFSDLETIVKTAWEWHSKSSKGKSLK